MTNKLRWAFPLCLMGSVFIGCDDDGTTGDVPDGGMADGAVSSCATVGTGMVTVTVNGLPAGVAGNVALAGPAGSQVVTATATLSLAGGTYTATPATVIVADSVVRSVFKGTGASACAKDGTPAAITVTYAMVRTSNKLWLNNGPGGAGTLAFASASLRAAGSPAPTVSQTKPRPADIAFDKDGNLWVASGEPDTAVRRYPAAAVAGTAPAVADVVLTGEAFSSGGVPTIASLALDAAGNLWVGKVAERSIIKFSAAQIAVTGTPTPVVKITGFEGAADGLAFDSAGNLWIAATRPVRYNAANLVTSGSRAPDVTLNGKTPSPIILDLTDPLGLAFDKLGNLWVNYSGNIVRVTPAEQTSSAVFTPAIQIPTDVLGLPNRIAFDESGAMWFAAGSGKFAAISATDLMSSGSKTALLITGTGVEYATAVAFFPAPAGLPIFHSLP
jgi:ligand-binding sensor domain-containing protein